MAHRRVRLQQLGVVGENERRARLADEEAEEPAGARLQRGGPATAVVEHLAEPLGSLHRVLQLGDALVAHGEQRLELGH